MLSNCYLCDKIKEDGMGGACGTWGENKCIGFGRKNLKEGTM